MTADAITRLEALLEAASPGPWEATRAGTGRMGDNWIRGDHCTIGRFYDGPGHHDSRLAALAPALARASVQMARSLRALYAAMDDGLLIPAFHENDIKEAVELGNAALAEFEKAVGG